ncbi:hypothetical protein KZZ07_25730 [Mameliella sp. CS4]|uniref:hypothetical protein n=1 Tax=Mameliella sp. CS4 TaxID=2862329 RepID=UPI001C5D0788|nr:hypothetical protein [Mameliella sp. CS4]MBW4985943.1 hypothetical protein [Mameliella sp. CS4]
MTMAEGKILNPNPPEFERFLYASVGEDRNGYVVTVLSTLARLGLDPWKEAAELVALGRDGGRARLGTLLARFRDVPTLASDNGRVARDLTLLLPVGQASLGLKRAVSTVGNGRLGTGRAIWAILAIVFVLYQVLTAGGSGFGE